jgi:hypothetical protein
MTDFTTSLGFQFRLTGVTGNSFDARTRQNVRKRVENVVYLEIPPADAVKLAYVGSKELSPINNLFIGDRSDSLFANARIGTIQEFSGVAQPIYIQNKNFLVTQAFNEAEDGRIPLYYKHVFSTTPANFIAASVRVYDKDFNPVSSDKYRLATSVSYDEDVGIPVDPEVITGYHLYNNLESSYDPVTGEYEAYFVQYTEIVGGAEVTRTKLLDNELAFHEATVEDMWWITGHVKPWVDAYLLDPVTMRIELPLPAAYSVRYQETNRISAKPPVALDDTSPWFPRVVNGSFNTGYSGYGVSYKIPEFENQAFNPIEPYKLAVRVGCDKIDDYLIKLPHGGIQHGSLFSYFYLTVALDGAVQYAVTNDTTKDGDEYRDINNFRVYDNDGDAVLWSTDQLLGIDSFSGIAHVNFKVLDSYELHATYSYTEQYYEVTSLNMNPVFDQLAAQELRALYLVPESSVNDNTGKQLAAIEWVKVAPSGLITATSQDGGSGNENLDSDVAILTTNGLHGYRIGGVIGLHYNWRASTTVSGDQEVLASGELTVSSTSTFPRSGWIRFLDTLGFMRYAKYVSKTDTALELSADVSEVAEGSGGLILDSGDTIELVNFVDERTTLTVRTAEYELDHAPKFFSGMIGGAYVLTPLYAAPQHFNRYFVLAEMSVNPPHSHEELVVIDLREDGGGVAPEKYEEAKALQPQVQWYNNFNDFRGQPYPGNAVVVVKLPATLLDSFTELEIKQIVEANVSFGIKPLIRYYGYEPNVTSVLPDIEGLS